MKGKEGCLRLMIHTAAAPVRASCRQFQVWSAASRDTVASRRSAGMSREEERVSRKERPPARS